MSRSKRGRSSGGSRAVPARSAAAGAAKFQQAVAFHAKGQLAAAQRLYREVLAANPDHVDALHWLGVIEGQHGDLRTALALLLRAVELNPRDPVVYDDLGTAQRELNLRAQALQSFERALALKPDYAKAFSDRGVVLLEMRRLEEALASLEQALALNPNDVDTLLRSCRVLRALGDADAAIGRCLHALALEESDRTRGAFAELLKGIRFSSDDLHLGPYLIRAMTEAWGRPTDLALAGISLLLLDERLRQCVARTGGAQLSVAELFGPAGPDAACGNPLLACLMANVPLGDPALERFLTAARRGFLLDIVPSDHPVAEVSPTQLSFLCALAQQCFINEYLFAADEDELEAAGRLRERVGAALGSGGPVSASEVALLAAYFPLGDVLGDGPGNGVSAALLLQRPAPLSAVLEQQFDEPRRERALRAEIRPLTAVDDGVSRQVRQQYEENPYPRWVKCPTNVTAATVDGYVGGRFPYATFVPLGKANDTVDILVAGCGTGQHALETALLFRGARVLAVDLSLSSLAYALRKTRDMGIAGIDYAQADILELGAIEQTFDVIEAVGVLHHLKDPSRGFQALLSRLRPGGFLRIGLYSERARQPVVAARRLIAEQGYAADIEGIRQCRQLLTGAGTPGDRSGIADADIRSIMLSPDFFSTSACRDLLFHVQEHRFKLPQIDRMVRDHGLTLVGLEVEAATAASYAARFPEDRDMTDLAHWEEFEAAHPRTFAGMVVFWVQQRELAA